MPTTYAHWRFGVDCIETLPQKLKDAINNHRELFDLGVHGPDIFFYDLTHKDVAAYGGKIHHEPGRIFFDHAMEVYRGHDDEKEAMLSYILGFLSHYTFDSQCHGYINRKADSCEGLSHNKVESEYDGHLMRLDGRPVAQTDRAASLKPNRKDAGIIARFFPYSEQVILRTTKAQQFIISSLNCRSDFKRNVLAAVLEKLGMLAYRDLIVQKDELPVCADSNMRIDKLRAYALELYPVLAEDLMKAAEQKHELCSYFEHDFDPEDHTSPVLSAEEELNYIPEKIV